MIMDVFSVVAVVLLVPATAGVLDLWFNGSIFAEHRARLEAQEGLIAELFRCPRCLSVHIVFWLFLVGILPGLLWYPAGHITNWLVYWPAAYYVSFKLFNYLN